MMLFWWPGTTFSIGKQTLSWVFDFFGKHRKKGAQRDVQSHVFSTTGPPGAPAARLILPFLTPSKNHSFFTFVRSRPGSVLGPQPEFQGVQPEAKKPTWIQKNRPGVHRGAPVIDARTLFRFPPPFWMDFWWILDGFPLDFFMDFGLIVDRFWTIIFVTFALFVYLVFFCGWIFDGFWMEDIKANKHEI